MTEAIFRWRDSMVHYSELMKFRITSFVLITYLAGVRLAPDSLGWSETLLSCWGTFFVVGAANVLNMYLERETDALMERTCRRPLPSGTIRPERALLFGGILLLIGLLFVWLGSNLLTTFLGLFAFVVYVLFYTPLKQKSTVALFVGAISGALPPLMGWTAATGSIQLPGIVLFTLLYLWQIPHFIAISLMHQGSYEKAGIRILPTEKGEVESRHILFRYLTGLIAVSFYPVFLKIAPPAYFWTTLILGVPFLLLGAKGLKSEVSPAWARQIFFASIAYIPLVLLTLFF